MIDIAVIRRDPDAVRASLRARNMDPKLVDRFLAVDKEWREFTKEIDERRAQKKEDNIGLQNKFLAGAAVKSAKDALRDEKKRIKELKEKQETLETEREEILYQLPNFLEPDVPIGKDEKANRVIRTWGEPPKFDFTPKDHLELGEALGIIDVGRASEVSGSRFSYLMREAALLEFALAGYALSLLSKPHSLMEIADRVEKGYSAKPFVPVVPPAMIRPEVFRKMARLSPEDHEERYYLERDDLYLAGSAEHTLGPLHMKEPLKEADLPLRYAGFSTSFRREAGSYGKDTRGILRVHQFDKFELESFVVGEDSRKEQDFFVAIQEYLLQSLGLPYQVVAIASGDMGKPDARQIDIETWMPGEGRYRETHTADLMTDYQARRLQTKVKRKNGKIEFVHMNDATAFAIGRTLIAILENYQTEDGGVEMPKALWPYLGFQRIDLTK